MAQGFSVSLLAGALVLALAAPAQAQIGTHAVAAPDYSSDVQAGNMSPSASNTPESDGRPGVYYFNLGAEAFRKGDYRHAVEMYKVAASWAYKPAEYDLALMYYRGNGVPKDRALGAAWMILAAERNTPIYVRARDLMITQLSDSEFHRTDESWNELKHTYGDEVALHRAKAQWAYVRNNKTGTRVGGGVGELRVGGVDPGHAPKSAPVGPGGSGVNAMNLMHGGGVDGAIAYSEFEQSSNPYDPVFQKNLTGTATVGPLTPAKASDTSSQQQPDNGGHNL